MANEFKQQQQPQHSETLIVAVCTLVLAVASLFLRQSQLTGIILTISVVTGTYWATRRLRRWFPEIIAALVGFALVVAIELGLLVMVGRLALR